MKFTKKKLLNWQLDEMLKTIGNIHKPELQKGLLGIPYLSMPQMERSGNIRLIYSTRFGGVSEGDFATLNLSDKVGDPPENVRLNRELFLKSAGISGFPLMGLNQVHQDKILIFHKDDGLEKMRKEAQKGYDGIISDALNIVFFILTADCLPITIFEPKNQVIALIHAGWRGTLREIARKAIHLMCKKFYLDPAQLLVALGPSIGRCCYTVKSDVFKEFNRRWEYATEFFKPNLEPGSYNFDLRGLNLFQLVDEGVQWENIFGLDCCTSCHSNVFFSKRANKAETGRLMTACLLKG